MIETYFSTDTLGSPQAFLVAFIIGGLFGLVLERSGFGSSRRLSGVFYLTDMTVIKVMFTALLTAAILLSLLFGLGLADHTWMYIMPTVYGAASVGGILFGAGFVMGGWCPGTAVVGAASGKYDAGLFLFGAVLGAVFFNEMFPLILGLYDWGNVGVVYIYESFGMPRWGFLLLLSLACWGVVILCKRIEGTQEGSERESQMVPVMIAVAVSLSLALAIIPEHSLENSRADLMVNMESGSDHVEPEDLARRLVAEESGLVVVDIRSSGEYKTFHLRGAVNIAVSELKLFIENHPEAKSFVLYSNGMTHPAQVRDEMQRMGFNNVFMLTDGLTGFKEACLKPVSLRHEPVPESLASEINEWRKFFGKP